MNLDKCPSHEDAYYVEDRTPTYVEYKGERGMIVGRIRNLRIVDLCNGGTVKVEMDKLKFLTKDEYDKSNYIPAHR